MKKYIKNNKAKAAISFLFIFLFYPKLAAMLLLIFITNIPVRSMLKRGKEIIEKLMVILEMHGLQ